MPLSSARESCHCFDIASSDSGATVVASIATGDAPVEIATTTVSAGLTETLAGKAASGSFPVAIDATLINSSLGADGTTAAATSRGTLYHRKYLRLLAIND